MRNHASGITRSRQTLEIFFLFGTTLSPGEQLISYDDVSFSVITMLYLSYLPTHVD